MPFPFPELTLVPMLWSHAHHETLVTCPHSCLFSLFCCFFLFTVKARSSSHSFWAGTLWETHVGVDSLIHPTNIMEHILWCRFHSEYWEYTHGPDRYELNAQGTYILDERDIETSKEEINNKIMLNLGNYYKANIIRWCDFCEQVHLQCVCWYVCEYVSVNVHVCMYFVLLL